MVSFNQVPIDILVPGQYVEIDNSQAVQGLSGIPTRILVIGQKLAAGTAEPLKPYLITSPDQARVYFGAGSQLAHMLEKFKAANSYSEVYAIAQIDNAAGAAASGSIVFGGTPTSAGTVSCYIGGRRVQVGVGVVDTADEITASLAAAINADASLPVTAAIDGVNNKKVVLTARHKGECANGIDLRLNYHNDENLPTGITAAITPLAGGSGNPSVVPVLDVIGDEWFTDFVMAYTDGANVEAIEEELVDRFGPLKTRDGHCYLAVKNTHANLVTIGDSRNCPHISTLPFKGAPNPPYEWAAILGAICSYNLKIDPARPVQSLTLPGLLAPSINERFSLVEQNILLHHGMSTFTIDAGANVIIQRIVTNYRENSFGASDPSFLDIETLKTLTYLRYDIRNFIAMRYPRFKLADDGTNFARGQAVVTPSVIKASLIARFAQWEAAGLVENIEQFKRDLIVERDAQDRNRVNALIPPDIINQLRVFAGLVQFRL